LVLTPSKKVLKINHESTFVKKDLNKSKEHFENLLLYKNGEFGRVVEQTSTDVMKAR